MKDISEYYRLKLEAHGETPNGVDWNGKDGQVLRFEQLMKITAAEVSYTINDLGCGYGALCQYLEESKDLKTYYGVDICEEMVETAKSRFCNDARFNFAVGERLSQIADFSVASGVMNVKLDRSNDEWEAHIFKLIEMMHEASRLGYAMNFLTSYSDKPRQKSYLYYADPAKIFDHVKRRYCKNIAILHDYNLYEFTLLARKENIY